METRQTFPIPEKFNVTENFGELIIEYPWSRVAGIIMFVFSLVWNGMLIFIMSKMPMEFRAFALIHAGIGVYLFYYSLCNLFNKTSIICTNDSLTIKSLPIPAFNNKSISAADIEQLYFTEKLSNGKNSTTITYQLHMIDKNNRSKRLIKNLPDQQTARYLEHKLEKFYKIKNVFVAGQKDQKVY